MKITIDVPIPDGYGFVRYGKHSKVKLTYLMTTVYSLPALIVFK